MKLLVIRFSALGDVVMTHPVIRKATELNPEVEIHFLTRKAFSFVQGSTQRVQVIGVEFDRGIKGFIQLIRLCFSLRQKGFDAVADLHGNLRSAWIRGFFRMTGIAVFKIDKGRREKRDYIQSGSRKREALRHHYLRYADVLQEAGCRMPMEKTIYDAVRWPEDPMLEEKISEVVESQGWQGKTLIGLAPFARHIWKELPVEKTEVVIRKILEESNGESVIFLIGGGDREIRIMKEWQKINSGRIKLLHEYLPLPLQVRFFSRMDVLMTMDSANLHLASLSQVPRIISIWGPTHADLGFGPSADQRNLLIQMDPEQLTCRPCSVFGNKVCSRGDHACMRNLDALRIAGEILTAVKGPSF